jgi:deoxyribodipyrimidine photo-lyase
MTPVLFWFRRDLRLSDNGALTAALAGDRAVIPVYIHAPEEELPWSPGAASGWWLHHSLQQLADACKRRGGRLILRDGPTEDALLKLCRETGADAVYANEVFEPVLTRRDQHLVTVLKKHGIALKLHAGNVLRHPATITNRSGGPYKVFTPFYRACVSDGLDLQTCSAPKRFPAVTKQFKSATLNKLNLLPPINWYGGLAQRWTPGTVAAQQHLEALEPALVGDYPECRDRPARPGTTAFSPYLHFGEISAREVAARLVAIQGDTRSTAIRNGADTLLRQLIWRDFAHYILWHFPHTSDKPFNDRFKHFKWRRRNQTQLAAWQQGRTGIPIVDAGMRELWHTGWMHNRIRMVTASFLTKNLGQHWLHGARWFWDTLVDADLAQNAMGWQWVAGCGVDAAPYFRIFNPVTQSKRFDAQGEYIRRWVPELRDLPDAAIHAPWEAKPAVLEHAGVRLGDTYPKPLVDLGQSRKDALARYHRVSGKGDPELPLI